jgi:hypothetical protein
MVCSGISVFPSGAPDIMQPSLFSTPILAQVPLGSNFFLRLERSKLALTCLPLVGKKTPSFRKGMIDDSTWSFLLFDVLPNKGDWRSAARSGKVAGRPKHAFPVPLFEFREPSAQVSRRYPLEAVDELGDCHFGRIAHQEMDMVLRAMEFPEVGLEIPADILEYSPHGVQDGLGEDFPAVLGHEDEMHMQVENAVPARADIACLSHRPMLS